MAFASNGMMYCCGNFANWMASGNGVHGSGRYWHDMDCVRFLPRAEYDYGMGSLLVLRADTPERADVIVKKGADEIVVLFGAPYHHATHFVAELLFAMRQAQRAMREDAARRLAERTETAV